MKRLVSFILFLVVIVSARAQTHPIAFFNTSEAKEVAASLQAFPLLTNSFNTIKKEVDQNIGKDIDVPLPKDPAGGYTHDKHKTNYMLMFNSGILFNLTGEIKYAELVKKMLLKYALLNPTLKKHPQATGNFPGRLFWQSLNDANWLVFAGLAYDLIRPILAAEEIKTIEQGAFKPEVDYFTKDLKDWFNLLHNHAVWACAGVGIVGIASDNKEYLEMAMYGTEKNGKAGFLAQLDNLFSPDGYYTEGPYYVRYAILPYMLFANAINNSKPELKIFNHRNNILQKALLTCLQQTNLNGTFFPLNDNLKDKDYTSNELVTAISIAWKVYGPDEGLLTVAKKQNRVILNMGGAQIASQFNSAKSTPKYFPYKTIESTDGVSGKEGGVSIMRLGREKDLTSLVFKYASQGLGHGHFDRLNINLFDQGNEIIQDYGSARFIGIEQKYGGRYLPENTGYAAQTIAHNTVVVDQKSHFGGDTKLGEQFHPTKLFSDTSNSNLLAVAARETNAYKGVDLQRHLYLLQTAKKKKFLIDIFYVSSDSLHQYDLPFQYNGQVISTSFPYQSYTKNQETLGAENGYQYLWKEAEATVFKTIAQFTFLNNNTYYTLSTLADDSMRIFFTRAGANDPSFNLRREPSYVLRTKDAAQTFVNIIEIHGNYDPINEFSVGAYSTVRSIKLLRDDAECSIVEIALNDQKIIVTQAKKDFSKSSDHRYILDNQVYSWKGPYSITTQSNK
ncbi:MAG: heparinase [Chitinophagaceae bacterium]|nr:heparinase [Chitinophagaceae bacterium]